MNESENRLGNGLEIDGRLAIEGIKAGTKSGAGVFWDLILSLNQAHENDEYEPPESFFSLFPDHVKFIQSGDNHIRYEVEQIRTLFQIWHEIYKAASETKNQIGLDEMMEWGKAFAEKYADFRVALENQKNYISYQLPAIAEIKTLKAELEKAKTTPETYAVGIESHLKRLDSIEKWMSSMYEKMDVAIPYDVFPSSMLYTSILNIDSRLVLTPHLQPDEKDHCRVVCKTIDKSTHH